MGIWHLEKNNIRCFTAHTDIYLLNLKIVGFALVSKAWQIIKNLKNFIQSFFGIVTSTPDNPASCVLYFISFFIQTAVRKNRTEPQSLY